MLLFSSLTSFCISVMLSLNAQYVFSNTSDANGICTPVCYFSFDAMMLLMYLIILACELIFPRDMTTPKGQCKCGRSRGHTISSDAFKEPREGENNS